MPEETSKARQITAQWYYKELWGWDLDEIVRGPERETFLKALLVCANGDGRLTDAERQWVVGRAAAGGAPDDLLEKLDTYRADEDIHELVSRTLANDKARRGVVYFAIKAASSDHQYAAGERDQVRRLAQAMGVSLQEVERIEHHVRKEEALKAERIGLCFPDGDPFAG